MNLLSTEEQYALAWYRALTEVERLAVSRWLVAGDRRLLDRLREHSERLQRFTYQSAPESLNKAALRRR